MIGLKDITDIRDKMPLNPNPNRRYARRALSDIKKIILHCTGTGEPNVFALAKYDVTPSSKHHISKKGCPGFTYHYFIERNGNSFFTSDLENITWHVGNHNKDSVGVCLQYASMSATIPPPRMQLDSAYEVIFNLCLELGIEPDGVLGHRELFGTGYNIVNGKKVLRKDCPGGLINMDSVRKAIGIKLQEFLAREGLYCGNIDGIWGPISKRAFWAYEEDK